MLDFKTGDQFSIKDGKKSKTIVEVFAVHDTLVQTITTRFDARGGTKSGKTKGGTNRSVFQQLIDNGYLQKL